jgi:hypothetical protein
MLALPKEIDAEIARLLRELALRDWARGCLRKRRYVTEEAAGNGALRQAHRYHLRAGLLSAYHCRHCHGWHVTSRPRRSAA